nr:restriction endonuclease [Halanaerobium saccharolyticum]
MFEFVIWELLKQFGYLNVQSSKLRGRGASHQIDAFGELAIPTAFMYPIRLICECKCYSENYKVRLPHIRNFVGVMKDISENYIVYKSGERNVAKRHNDVGCFFSASSFTIDAQEYAWAHNIFIISFNNNSKLKYIIKDIKTFVNNTQLKNKTKKEIIRQFKESNFSFSEDKNISVAIGIIDGVYPVTLIGNQKWLYDIDNMTDNLSEIILAEKTQRKSNKFDTLFTLNVRGEKINFTLPNIIANKIKNRVDQTNSGEQIFTIDIPYIRNINDNSIRRFVKIIVKLPNYEKEEYKKHIQIVQEENLR